MGVPALFTCDVSKIGDESARVDCDKGGGVEYVKVFSDGKYLGFDKGGAGEYCDVTLPGKDAPDWAKGAYIKTNCTKVFVGNYLEVIEALKVKCQPK